MPDKKDDSELSGVQQFLALAAVACILLLAVFVYSLFNKDSPEPNFSSCETRFDSTPCPEPDYDAELEETLRKYPDDSY